MNRDNYVVIMAGGIGSRFWPLSKSRLPKQFIDILGVGDTLIQQTFNRLSKIFSGFFVWCKTPLRTITSNFFFNLIFFSKLITL